MNPIKASILDCLKGIKGSGTFAAVHSDGFVFPGLAVDDIGEIAFPLQAGQAKALIKVARKAPFGKGSETVLDSKVRSGHEIDPDQLHFNNPEWTKFIDRSIEKLKKALGLEEYSIDAHLYKLLLYKKGDFFLRHKDSEKEDGMFGSLVIGLPSSYTGGELVIHFERETVIADFSNDADKFNTNCTAFYADCDHEVKPLKSGFRICLVYNLVQRKSAAKIELFSSKHYAKQLAKLITHSQVQKPYIILLGHQYTPANFSIEGLKLNDRYKTDALLQTAQDLGYYAKLCLVTSYKSGTPAYEHGYDYGEDDPNAPMEEVIDESLEIEHWSKSEVPALTSFRFEEDDLTASFVLDEGEPLIKESTGFMGNYGLDLMHWYHYGAVVIWSPLQNSLLLKEQNAVTQLEWVGYFNRMAAVSKEEKRAVHSILSVGFTDMKSSIAEAKFDVVADWLICHESKLFLTEMDNERLQMLFKNMGAASWQKIWIWLPKDSSLRIFEKLLEKPKQTVIEKLIAIICNMALSNETMELAEIQCTALPEYVEKVSQQTSFRLKAQTLSDLFWIEEQFSPSQSWVKTMNTTIVNHADRKYLHKVLVPQLLAEQSRGKLHKLLLKFCKTFLQKRVSEKPMPPKDWSRALPKQKKDAEVWKMLKQFMESPVEQVFELRKNMGVRSEVEGAILRVKVDLRTSTIKKGTPHTLRIEKTQASYARDLNLWRQDVELLGEVK